MDHIVIVNGYPRAGKDTLISEMISLLKLQGIRAKNVSMIAPTADMLRNHPAMPINFDYEKTPEVRALLANVHQALLEFSDAPIDAVIREGMVSKVDVLFTCCREPQTISRIRARALKESVRSHTLLVQRDKHEAPTTDADRDVEDYDYMHTVDNNGPLEFLPVLASDALVEMGILPRPISSQECDKPTLATGDDVQ